jgi:hypothetical protein
MLYGVLALWTCACVLAQCRAPRNDIGGRIAMVSLIALAVSAALSIAGDGARLLVGILSAHGLTIACAIVTDRRETART